MQQGGDVAVTKRNKTLTAFTCAAMSLPGIKTNAAVPVAEAEGSAQYGYYREQGNRMQAQVYHTDFVVPFADRVEFTFNADLDTYVGATPLYSVPDSIPDIVSAASQSFEAAWHMASPLLFSDESDALRPKFINEIILREGLPGFQADIPRFLKEADLRVIDTFINHPISNSTKTRQVIAEIPRESRTLPILGANLYLGNFTLGLSGGYSIEPDFKSSFGSGKLSWELNDKLTTVSAGYSLTHNEITRLGGHGSGHHSGFSEELDETSTFNSFTLGISQILSKNTLLQLNAGYTAQRGYLSNPYKFVYVRGEVTTEEYYDLLRDTQLENGDWAKYTDLEVVGVDIFREVRPDKRDQWFFATQLNQYIPALDASLHFNYRFYKDSWKINSHTFELNWYQSLPYGITITPHVRYYSQSKSDFFAPFFLAPRSDGYYSSDYRLSGFGKISSGLSISKEFAKGIKLGAGFEYYIHKGSLKLGGGGLEDYADITSYLLHANLQVNLSSLGNALTEQKEHHIHHHGSHPPAGVMAGHMLGQAGDMMIGYQYMYGTRSGDTINGTRSVSDREIINNACINKSCSSKAREMTMHMHMFNFMYAPTDWLNLMLMPQIISMEMDMEAFPGADSDEAHEGAHLSEGLGDTLIMALVKLFENPNHHLHLGIGISAPTGNFDATLDGLKDTDLQGYGMQLGSGTWDLKPSLTYTGQADNWSWGAQVSGTKRLQNRNSGGYALGDEIKGSAWGGYKFLPWLSGSVRGIYMVQGDIKGQYKGQSLLSAPTDFPENFGGKFWDIGIGLSASMPDGEFSDHTFSVEWLQPVKHDYNGFQLEKDGVLSVRWGYAF